MTIDSHWLNRPEGKIPAAVVHMPVQADMPAHDHLFHEMMLVEGGTAMHVTAAGRQRLRPGDLFIMRPQVWHGFEQTRRLSVINLLIAPELLRRFQDDFADGGMGFHLFRRRQSHPWRRPPVALHANPAQRQVIHQLLRAILREQTEQGTGWRVAVAACALQALVAISRLAQGQTTVLPSAKTSTMNHALQQAVSYLEANYDRAVSLDELAQHCSLSPYHLSRHFNTYLGMGINAYIHRLRAEQACRLLRSSELSITDIAMQTGYDDVAYFSRCFRQQVGMSPRAYRRVGFEPMGLNATTATVQTSS